jgi:hypothetical protein
MRRFVLRLIAGLALLGALLPLLFTATLPAIHRWGASDAELAQALPGDELLSDPVLRWTHGVTIDAPPARVWPWIAQLGDQRGGFYSFTFIENRVGALTGASDYQVVYRNANAIVPAWQLPRPGDTLIKDLLKVGAVEPGRWLLGVSVNPQALGWVWLWHLSPIDGGARTRLVVRCNLDVPPGMESPAAALMMDLGGFVMEQRMLHGLKLRAEGWAEPAWSEAAEIGLWLAALLCGLAAAWLFLTRRAWQRPLGIAVAAVALLFVLTFAQPPLWLRTALDGALAAGVWWAAARPRRAARAPHAAALPAG